VTRENSITTTENRADQFDAGRAQLHDLLPFTTGTRVFAVFADEVDATAEAKPFARLPRAPNSVVGIVCVRGRMLTVIDPAALLNNESQQWEPILPCVIALRSDEQLALAAVSYRDTITISAADIERGPETTERRDELILGSVTYANEEILILDTGNLFRRAARRRDRRRRRF
jgi:chemotaxis signal transduction protein